MKYTEENERIIDSWKEKYGLPWMEPISHKDFLRALIHWSLILFCVVLPCEGNGTPLHYSCLENPMDRGAW